MVEFEPAGDKLSPLVSGIPVAHSGQDLALDTDTKASAGGKCTGLIRISRFPWGL